MVKPNMITSQDDIKWAITNWSSIKNIALDVQIPYAGRHESSCLASGDRSFRISDTSRLFTRAISQLSGLERITILIYSNLLNDLHDNTVNFIHHCWFLDLLIPEFTSPTEQQICQPCPQEFMTGIRNRLKEEVEVAWHKLNIDFKFLSRGGAIRCERICCIECGTRACPYYGGVTVESD